MRPILLDGPLGTELDARGVATPLPGWSAQALIDAPDVVSAIHGDYAAAGAVIHTTNTFRTRPAIPGPIGERWEELARLAVRLARGAVPDDHRVAGSIAPLEDCYRPDLSPAESDPERTRAEHRALARVLADAGCDLLLCETFPSIPESLIAMDEAVATGIETWVSWTPGPGADLLTPAEVREAATEAVHRGARGVLVNCLPAARVAEYLPGLCSAADPGALVGAYANTGRPDASRGWETTPVDPAGYAELALSWHDAGATILAGCCGTGPAHVAALAAGLARVK